MARSLGAHVVHSPEWHAARDGRIGGSDIGTACGWNPYESRDELLQRKAALLAPRPETKAMRRGQHCEPAVLSWLAAEKHLTYDQARAAQTWQHDDHDWAIYNPDAITDDNVLVEAKSATARTPENGWGRAGTDAVPLTYAAQAQWGLTLLGLDMCWLGVLAGAGPSGEPDLHFAAYRIKAKPAVQAYLLDQAARFIDDLNHLTTTTQETAA